MHPCAPVTRNARSLMRREQHLRVLGGPVDEVRERLGALRERRVGEPAEVEVALGEELDGAREVGARVGELAAQADRPADEHGHRERALAPARGPSITMSPPFRTAASAARQVGSKPAASTTSVGRPARARRRDATPACAPSRSACSRRSGTGSTTVTCAPSRAATYARQQADRPAAEHDDLARPRRVVRRERADAAGERLGEHGAPRVEARREAARGELSGSAEPLGEDAGPVHADQPPRWRRGCPRRRGSARMPRRRRAGRRVYSAPPTRPTTSWPSTSGGTRGPGWPR